VRELREFREVYPEFREHGIELAGVSADTLESHRRWVERLRLPYPLLSDPERSAGNALGLTRRLGIGSWTVELFRRATILVDDHGRVAAVWADVKVRGHARQVLEAALALQRAKT
jgi:peroxiredoxin Q/BCP